jgi:heat shock protein HslJ
LWLLLASAWLISPVDGANQGRDADMSAAAVAELQGGEWRLLELTVAGIELPLPPEARATLQLQGDDKVGGVAFINRFFGPLHVTGDGTLGWGEAFGMTKMAGPPELMELEQAYLDALLQTDRLRLEAGQLILQSQDGAVLLRFEAVADANQ